jgi:hypothetical protein
MLSQTSTPLVRNPLDIDEAALKKSLYAKHGSEVGEMLLVAQVAKRHKQNERHATLVAELASIQADISAHARAAGERRAKSQARIEAMYSVYLAALAEEATADSLAEAPITQLRERSINVQQQMRNIAIPRLNEREMQDVLMHSAYASHSALATPLS